MTKIKAAQPLDFLNSMDVMMSMDMSGNVPGAAQKVEV